MHLLIHTSVLLDPRTICLAKEATLFTFTCTLSARRILESANSVRALVVLADAILSLIQTKIYAFIKMWIILGILIFVIVVKVNKDSCVEKK